MEITVYIRADTLYIETMPSDKRKADVLQYQNSKEGLQALQTKLNSLIFDEARKFHVLHNEVHLMI